MSKKLLTILVLVFSLILLLGVGFVHGKINIWQVYNEGELAREQGDYQTAIEKYQLVIPEFITQNDLINVALMYQKMGQCQAELEKYDDAVHSWRQEAEYWRKAEMAQEVIIANRRAERIQSRFQIFVKLNLDEVTDLYYHGVKFEPKAGALLGAYAENDAAVHDLHNWKYHFTEKFPQLVGKKHALYLVYVNWGRDYLDIESYLEYARANDSGIQLALQPVNGLDSVNDGPYIRELARNLEAAGVPIFLRFANEMNGEWVPWYERPEKYIEKFRLVSKIFHEEAPEHVVMVWSPNDFPPNNIEAYYPGDAYVDWVGVSMYTIYNQKNDPLNQGIDRTRHVEKFEHIYQLYADRKPVFISEGGISYISHIGEMKTSWASSQIEEFYASLPMLYPGIKGVFWFDANVWGMETSTEITFQRKNSYAGDERSKSYLLSANPTILSTYQDVIQNPFYLENIGENASYVYRSIEQYSIPARPTELGAYVKTVQPGIAKVFYSINGSMIGSASTPPWSIEYDFTAYRGKTIEIVGSAYNQEGELLTTRSFRVYVE